MSFCPEFFENNKIFQNVAKLTQSTLDFDKVLTE
jgi:hypothetical protein